MTTIVMNIDECDIEHEALMLKEYGEEVKCAEWNPQFTLVCENRVKLIDRPTKKRKHSTVHDVDSPSALEEVIDSPMLVRSSSFPQCP